jgi:hypothetical protein
VTYGRSGSTVLMKILNAIPGIHVTGENYFALFGLFQSYRSARETRSRQGSRNQSPDSPWYGADQIDPRNFGHRLAEVFVDEIVRPPRGSRTVGFKEIRLVEHMEDFEEFLDFVRTFFSPARIIFSNRRAEDVAKSGWWRNNPPALVMELVERFDTQGRLYAEAHPDAAIVVSYDEFTRNPETLRELFRFLGARFDRKLVDDVLKVPLKHLKR